MSYSQSDPFANIRGSIIRAGAPITVFVIAANVLLFLVNYFGHGLLAPALVCQISGRHLFPLWSPITYPLLSADFINLVFACLWFWFMGSSLERSWGTQRFGIFALGLSVLTALCVWLGCALLHAGYALIGLWVPLCALTVAWAAVNPRQVVQVYMVLPVPAWALAAFSIGLLYFVYFGGEPMLGLFGLLPSAAAFAVVRHNLMTGYAYRGYARRGPDLKMVGARKTNLDGSRAGFNPFGWYRDRQERKRLEKLWKDSGFSDKDKRP